MIQANQRKDVKSKYREAGKTFVFFLLGFYLIVIAHELTHGFIAGEFCHTVQYNWVPTTEYLANTQYAGCSATTELMRLQRITEIVGYQLMALYTALASFIILYSQKVKF